MLISYKFSQINVGMQLAIFSLTLIVGLTLLSFGTFSLDGQASIAMASGAKFNDDPLDRDTLRSMNYTVHGDVTDQWALVTEADAGDIVSLAVYYHNTSVETAENVRVHISVPSGFGTSFNATGGVVADNAPLVSGQTTINISSSRTLTYISGSARWQPDQSTASVPFPFGQS